MTQQLEETWARHAKLKFPPTPAPGDDDLDEIHKQIAYLDAILADLVIPSLRSLSAPRDGAHVVAQSDALMTEIIATCEASDPPRTALLSPYATYVQSIIQVATLAGY